MRSQHYGAGAPGGPVRGLTFELSRHQRWDAGPGLATMYRVPPDRAWWPAVGARLERGVRRQFTHHPDRSFGLLPRASARIQRGLRAHCARC